MVYKMVFNVDGGCRRNGQARNVIGAAAVVWDRRYSHKHRARALPSFSPSYGKHVKPTNQRAEITAVVLALEWALERYAKLRWQPWLRVLIYSDSQYAVNCMTDWIPKWTGNGWRNAKGLEVANRDLLEVAWALDDMVRELGSVRYVWTPREQNRLADQYCNEALDRQEVEEEY